MLNVQRTLKWDKLAIVLSVAAVALMLVAPPLLAQEATPTPEPTATPTPTPADVPDATPPDDGGIPLDVLDATPPDDGTPPLDVPEATPAEDGGRPADKPVPPGQLKRRGIHGTILETGDGFVIIETKFGPVTINVEDSEGFETGDRFAALLDKSPVPLDATDPTDGSFRTVTALRVKGIPGKASRKHQRAVVVDDRVVARPMMYLALSYDHRIVDGREAVQFLVRVKEVIEDPTRILLEI